MTDGMRSLARSLKAFGDETRLGLVSLLAQQERGSALCIGRVAQELESIQEPKRTDRLPSRGVIQVGS
jgi:DNA-binding transcriptional ArsR family regulator